MQKAALVLTGIFLLGLAFFSILGARGVVNVLGGVALLVVIAIVLRSMILGIMFSKLSMQREIARQDWENYKRNNRNSIDPIDPLVNDMVETILSSSCGVAIFPPGTSNSLRFRRYWIFASDDMIEIADRLPDRIAKLFSGITVLRPSIRKVERLLSDINTSECLPMLEKSPGIGIMSDFYTLSNRSELKVGVESVYFDYLRGRYPNAEILFGEKGPVIFVQNGVMRGYVVAYTLPS